jgi:type IV secretory pathway VirB4 component
MESSQIVTMHLQSVDQNAAIKTVKHTITELDRSKIEEQKKAVRAGYDMDIIPSDLATYGSDAKALLKELQSQNERMFLMTFLVMNTGKTKQELENNVFQAASIAQKHNCNLIRLDYQQEQGLMSMLPLAHNLIEIERGMTTSSTAIFVPFTTQELFQNGPGALYYGLNALSNNMIIVDRKKLKNPNALILGTPGSGKSFSAKREITNCFLVTDDDIIISDPESEYSPLVERLDGQVIKISPTSDQFINPMDINMNYSDEDNPIALKADFILSLCELIVGSKDGLRPVEKTVIDRCIHQIYQRYFENPGPENMPVLGDLYQELIKQEFGLSKNAFKRAVGRLLKQEEPEARHVATALEIYVTGSLNVFNHRTNVELTNRLVCYDIKDLGKQLKKIGMLVVQDQVWGRVTENRSQGRSTRYYMDEMHLLLREEQTAAYTVEIWKRFRKWGGIPTGITQNVKDLLASKEVENIFENSDFIYMLNQAVGDRQILAKQLNISPHQLSYVTHSGEGEGLLFYGNVILPFVDRFPANTELYRIMTTRLSEVAETAAKAST